MTNGVLPGIDTGIPSGRNGPGINTSGSAYSKQGPNSGMPLRGSNTNPALQKLASSKKTTAVKPQTKVVKTIKVNLNDQIVEAFEGNSRVFLFDCVTGDKDHPTDIGVFTILRKHKIYRSRTYNVQMNYAMFFTTDGKALHQYHGPVALSIVRTSRHLVSEWFGSHGCVRLVEADAKALFEWAPVGSTVQVS
jgi:lipoprotein-anchoring transpeptidase ErfK/SrfK